MGELSAHGVPINGELKCSSWTNHSGFRIPSENGKNMLTNVKDGDFTITELEVWEVKFID